MNTRRKIIQAGAMITFATYLGIPTTLLQAAPEGVGPAAKFFKACSQGDLRKVKVLTDRSPTILSAKDPLGRSGYALALLFGHQAIAEFLKEKGYKSDLHEAALALEWERFNALLGEESEATAGIVNAHHSIGGSSMWAAAKGGAGSDIWRVYAKCGDPNILSNPEGTSPLQAALRFSDLSTAEMTAANLVGNNADPNLAGTGDWSPLAIAAERGSVELVEMLIRRGAKTNWKNAKGKSILQIAEKAGQQEVWKMIKNHQDIPRTCQSSREAINAEGAKYQVPDFTNLPLYLRNRMVGKSHGDLEYVKKAIANDSRIAHSTATTSEKSVEASAHLGRKPMVEVLLKAGAPYSLPTAVMMNDFSTVKHLLEEDPKRIYERGPHDFALLWYPMIGRCGVEMTQLLLDRGAKIEEQHFLGTTALHWACMRDQLEVVELLLENGANVNRLGRRFKVSGEKPLQITKDDKIKRLLKSRGATD